MTYKKLAALILSFLIASLCFASLAQTVETAATEAPPDENVFLTMEINDMNGQPFDVSQLEGKPLMLNFWASWCGPCVSEMPDLNQLSQTYGDRLAILGIMSDAASISQEGVITLNQGEIDDARAFYEKAGITYPSLIPNELMFAIMYQLQMQAIPTTLFINPQGFLSMAPIQGSRSKEDWTVIIDAFLADIEGGVPKGE